MLETRLKFTIKSKTSERMQSQKNVIAFHVTFLMLRRNNFEAASSSFKDYATWYNKDECATDVHCEDFVSNNNDVYARCVKIQLHMLLLELIQSPN